MELQILDPIKTFAGKLHKGAMIVDMAGNIRNDKSEYHRVLTFAGLVQGAANNTSHRNGNNGQNDSGRQRDHGQNRNSGERRREQGPTNNLQQNGGGGNQQRENQQREKRCFTCKEVGHLKRDCPRRRNQTQNLQDDIAITAGSVESTSVGQWLPVDIRLDSCAYVMCLVWLEILLMK